MLECRGVHRTSPTQWRSASPAGSADRARITLVRTVALSVLVGRADRHGLAVSLRCSSGLIYLLLASDVAVAGSDGNVA